MNFNEALKVLGIEDYAERIFSSNSHGELNHLQDYISFAEQIDNKEGWFRKWFELVVKDAEENWKRPESVFQHMPKIFADDVYHSIKN